MSVAESALPAPGEEALRKELERIASDRRQIRQKLNELEYKERSENPQSRAKRPRGEKDSVDPEDASSAKRVKVSEDNAHAPGGGEGANTSTATENDDEPNGHARQAPVPRVQVNRDRRMFQQLLGTLHGFKKQIEDQKTASTLQKRQEVEQLVASRFEESNAKQADEYRRKLAEDIQKARDRDAELEAELRKKEDQLHQALAADHFAKLSKFFLTPASAGPQIAWIPGKRDDFVMKMLEKEAAERSGTFPARRENLSEVKTNGGADGDSGVSAH